MSLPRSTLTRTLLSCGPIYSLVAFGLGLGIALNCGASDWQQGIMLSLLPVIAGAGVALPMVSPTSGLRAHLLLALLLGAATGAGAWIITFVLWASGCSS